jgi:mannosyl-3-phosphoglycerate phosphatase
VALVLPFDLPFEDYNKTYENFMDLKNTQREKFYLIFTDLDDTLLDSNYEYKYAETTLCLLKEKNIPIIFCSNKTFAEQGVYINKMGIKHPFIVECGSAIFIPKRYFKEKKGKETGDYDVVILGTGYKEIKKEIDSVRKRYYIRSYCTMTVEEVAKQMDLDLEGARLAKCTRQFTETIIEADDNALEELRKKCHVIRGGRAISVCGKGADKGKAVKILTELYKKELGDLTTVGLGNSYNDEAMLRMVDIPILVKNPNGNWADIAVNGLYRTEEIGPKGWCEAIDKILLEPRLERRG